MKIVSKEKEGVLIVLLSGSLETTTSAEAESFLLGKIDDGARKILIDLADMDYISSAGLRVLLITAKKLSSEGGALHLCHLNEDVQEVFDMSGFTFLLKVFESFDAAIYGLL